MIKSYWHWFFFGTGYKPGFLRFLNIWIVIHIGIGCIIAIVVKNDISEASKAVLLPLAGVLVGLAFAWGGNAMALLQTDEIDKFSDYHPGGFEEYVYVYQSAILTILITLSLWGIAGLEVFDSTWPTNSNKIPYYLCKVFLYSLSSLSLRECWHVVLGAQQMLLTKRQMKKMLEDKKKNNKTAA